MHELRRGLWFGFAAYVLWGLFPLYWPLLRPAALFEVLAHRIVWTCALSLVATLLLRDAHRIRALSPDRIGLLLLASLLVSSNWAVYIYGVTTGHVVETSLGYFINPLMSVCLGVAMLREKLRRGQWTALGIAAVAVLVLTLDYGRLPWISLFLASSFALYGLVKKRAAVPALPSLVIETAFLIVPAVGYLVVLDRQSAGTFLRAGAAHDVLLISSGIATAIPLLCFSAAANRIPLSTIGMLQYLAPSLQFLCGVLVFRESMPASRWIGFTLVWGALILLTLDALRQHSRTRAISTHEGPR